MGQKVPPLANRVGYIEDWGSRWFDLKNAPEYVEQDFHIRSYIKEKFRNAIITRVDIERTGKQLIVDINTVRPGIIIGRGGENIGVLTRHIEKLTGMEKVSIKVTEVKQPALNAQATAEFIALWMEKNMNYRRVLKNSITKSLDAGALGVKIRISGRLGGVEIARSEWYREGRIPSNTFRAVISYGFAEALIKKGKIGIKVWIFLRELMTDQDRELVRSGRLHEVISGRRRSAAEEN